MVAMPSADVFISYSQKQRSQVELIAKRLQEDHGLSVWFDANLKSGAEFDEEINREVQSAKAVLVCWTTDAIASTWVRAEAEVGRRRGVLAAVFLGPTDLPVPFTQIHTEDLTGWRGDTSHPAWLRLLARLRELVQFPARPGTSRVEFAFEPKALFNRMPPPRIGERWTEISTFRAGKTWTGSESFLTAIEWDSKNDVIFTAGQLNGLRCWTIGGAEIARMKIKGPRFFTGSIAVANFQSAPLVATAGHGPLCVWSNRSYHGYNPGLQLQHEFTDQEYVAALAWQPVQDYVSDPQVLAASVSCEERYSSGPGGTFCLWDIHTGVKKWSHPCHVSYRLHWAPTGDHVSAPDHSGTGFEIFRLSGERLSLKTADDDDSEATFRPRRMGFAWHPSSRYFATGISDREIGIYELASLNQVRALILDTGHRGSWIRSVQWSPDGQYITASTAVDTTVVFHTNQGEPVAAMYGTMIDPNDLAFSPDGQRLATRGKDGLRIWDPARGEEVATIPNAGDQIRQIRWHPDSRRIAFGHNNGRVKIARLEF
jgi:WD40 repeat protein